MAPELRNSLYQDVEGQGYLKETSISESEKSTDTSSEHDLFLPELALLRNTKGARIWPWKVATALFASISIFLGLLSFLQRGSSRKELYSGPQISSSDFPAAAREAIELQEVTFTGNTAFYRNGTGYVPHPSPIQYFGEPSLEVDERWEELTGSRDFLISEVEAKELWPNDYQIHWDRAVNGYPIGLDVFHTLHCLNDIRKLFYPDYYPVTELNRKSQDQHRAIAEREKSHADNHRVKDHCLDQIRQYVMCAGDMTPYGSLYYEGIGYNYADSDVTHTCRNFDKLREWTTRRYHAGGELHMPGVDVWE